MKPSIRLLLLSAVAGTVIIGCHDDPVSQDRCTETTILSGVEDSFSPGNQENATPNEQMLQYMDYEYRVLPAHPLNQLTTRFDESTADRAFGHTIRLDGVPEEATITAATVTVRVKALGGQDYNDGVVVVDRSESGEMKTLGGMYMADYNGGSWTYGNEASVVFDLAKLPTAQGPVDILKHLEDGEVSVYVQDDTSVDYIKLDVSYCLPEESD